MTIAVYGSRRQHSVAGIISSFLNNLRVRGIEILMHGKLYDHLTEIAPDILDGVVRAESCEGADLVVSLGGDGTFLRTAMWVGAKQIPVVGVNTGHLGYLSALAIEELPYLIDYLESDRFRIEPRTLLCVDAPELPDYVGQYALNEVSLTKEETASMITARVSLDGAPLADYRADGLLVCTSTGSTAYNLSVGGPIVQPTLEVCVLSPIAAHSLSMRPMVVDAHSTITIVPSGRSRHLRLALDGRSMLIDMETEIRISRAPFKLQVVEPALHTFADTLRHKLHWGEQ